MPLKTIGIRAVRNNNPGNVERKAGVHWQGTMPREKMNELQKAEKRFEVMATPADGFRMMFVTLITYYDKRRAADGSQIDTFREFAARWAPSFENNVEAYAKAIDRNHPKGMNDTINIHCWEDAVPMVKAMSIHECGGWYFNDADLRQGALMAGIKPPKKEMKRDVVVQAGTTAGVGTGVASILDTLDPLKEQVSQLAWYIDAAKYLMLALVIASIGLMIYAQIKRNYRT